MIWYSLIYYMYMYMYMYVYVYVYVYDCVYNVYFIMLAMHNYNHDIM